MAEQKPAKIQAALDDLDREAEQYALAPDYALIARLMCEGRLRWLGGISQWMLSILGDNIYSYSTLDPFGVPRLTPELRMAIKEAGL